MIFFFFLKGFCLSQEKRGKGAPPEPEPQGSARAAEALRGATSFLGFLLGGSPAGTGKRA